MSLQKDRMSSTLHEKTKLEESLQAIGNVNLQLLGLLYRIKQSKKVADGDLKAANSCVDEVEKQTINIRSVTSTMSAAISRLNTQLAAKEKTIESLRPYHDKAVKMTLELEATETKLHQLQKSFNESQEFINALSPDYFDDAELSLSLTDTSKQEDMIKLQGCATNAPQCASTPAKQSKTTKAIKHNQGFKTTQEILQNQDNLLSESQEGPKRSFHSSADSDSDSEKIVPAKYRRDNSNQKGTCTKFLSTQPPLKQKTKELPMSVGDPSCLFSCKTDEAEKSVSMKTGTETDDDN